MSYIIKTASPLVNIKLTEVGRQNLAKGQLNFISWGIGDSEINYDREAIVDANPSDPTLSATSMVFRPFDKQPNIKSFITTTNGNNLTPMNPSNINVVQATVNNAADERGFFSGSTTAYTTLSSATYVKAIVTVSNTTISGTTTLKIPLGTNVAIGDFIRLKLTSNGSTATAVENTKALANFWYKVQSTASTATLDLTLDRNLPNNSAQNTSSSFVFVYPQGEVANSFGSATSTAYWDSGTLSFDSATNITCGDVKVWNMNNVWCENIIGITGLSTTNLYENYTKFGSYPYLGTKNPYLEYICTSTGVTDTFQCNGPGFSYPDDVNKAISILHYSNNTISNLYGEFLYIDTTNNKVVRITLPDLMYHRSNFTTSSGTTMGMSFISSGNTFLLGNSDIQYMNLIEDPTLIGNRSPKAVGKVFPQLKVIVIDDEEIVAAISYKSNRNWTLPPLSASLSTPTGGTSNGMLGVNQTIYLTYVLDSPVGTGYTANLPCQEFIKVTNNSSSSKDIAFAISDVDLLPYMRKKEFGTYDGLGFYAYKFRLLYQIVSDQNARPDPGAWRSYDYTTGSITVVGGQTIDPKLLQNQIPTVNGFLLTAAIDSGTTLFDITIPMGLAPNSNSSILQFGDERFFYGNLQTYIGATIFKTIFDIRVNSAQYSLTSNPTRSKIASSNPPNIKVSEVGVYDNNNNLVVIGKLGTPVALINGQTIMFELSMDF